MGIKDFIWKGHGDLRDGRATGTEGPRGQKGHGDRKGHGDKRATGPEGPRGNLAPGAKKIRQLPRANIYFRRFGGMSKILLG